MDTGMPAEARQNSELHRLYPNHYRRLGAARVGGRIYVSCALITTAALAMASRENIEKDVCLFLALEEHAMANGFRFGRRVKLPSTVEIKHELRMLILADSVDALQREAAALKVPGGNNPSLAAPPRQWTGARLEL